MITENAGKYCISARQIITTHRIPLFLRYKANEDSQCYYKTRRYDEQQITMF